MESRTIFEKLIQSKKVAIFTHINPDGDCLGSAIALGKFLVNIGKNVVMFCEDQIHENFHFFAKGLFKNVFEGDYDLMISVDCSDINRMGKLGKKFAKSKCSINIDHHLNNTNFAIFNLVRDDLSSTCELLYLFFKENNIKLDDQMAKALYCGILTDTGGFIHNNTTSQTHEIASDLLKFDFDKDQVHYYLMKRRTVNQLMLLKRALSSMILFAHDEVAIMRIRQLDFKATNTSEKDTMGIVNYATNIDSVKMAVLISEVRKNSYQVSFRSKGEYDVNKMAAAFGGGGHKYAAGCKFYGSINQLVKNITHLYIGGEWMGL